MVVSEFPAEFEKSVVAGHVKPVERTSSIGRSIPLLLLCAHTRRGRYTGDGNIGGHPLNQSNDSRRRQRPYVFSLNRPINRRNRLLIEWKQVDCRLLSLLPHPCRRFFYFVSSSRPFLSKPDALGRVRWSSTKINRLVVNLWDFFRCVRIFGRNLEFLIIFFVIITRNTIQQEM